MQGHAHGHWQYIHIRVNLKLTLGPGTGSRNASGSCALVTVGPAFNPSGYGVGFPKTSLTSMHFSRAILGLLAEGAVDQLQDRSAHP